jgi:hypothetical protein
MSGGFELKVEGKGLVPHALPVGSTPLSVGRGGSNDLVVTDAMVSWQHMKIWADDEAVWVSDAGSTNGTFVNDQPIRGTAKLEAGDRISVGGLALTVVQYKGLLPTAPPPRAIAVEEVGSGLQHPLRAGRFLIGSADDADLRIPNADAPYVAEFAVHGPDDCMVQMGTDDFPLEVGEEIEIAGIRFRLVEVADTRLPTLQPSADRFPFRLEASLDGPTGPFAEITHLRTGASCRIEAETRAILMYLLANQIEKHRETETPPDEIGWCPDDDIIVGVWGRSGLNDGANRLKVLVHRLRAELKKSGVDPWLIERRRRYIRARVRDSKTS